MPKRTYKEAFLGLGFTEIISSGESKPQCVVCSEVLSNEALKESKLLRHLRSKHPALEDKELDYFKTLEGRVRRGRLTSASNPAVILQKNLTLASFDVAWKMARKKVAHTMAEDLVKPAIIDVLKILEEDAAAKKVSNVPMSNDTIRRRIAEMSADVREQVVQEMKAAGKFGIQLDESTDTSNDPQLLVYVRYRRNDELVEEMLFCHALVTTTTGADIFNCVDQFFCDEGLSWQNCFSITTDGAPAMLGPFQGFYGCVKQVQPDVVSVHCMLHRENLASKELGGELSAVMKDVVDVVNFINARALNSRIFAKLCAEVGAEHVHLLYHSSVRWLSRGKVLARVVELRTEVEMFLVEKKHNLAAKFNDPRWLLQAAYLADVFGELNILNSSMQGRNTTVVDLTEKLLAFKQKLKLWQQKVDTNRTAVFPTFNLLLEDSSDDDAAYARKLASAHLEKLAVKFEEYLPPIDVKLHSWVRQPFDCQVEDAPDSPGVQEELIEVQHDYVLRQQFKEKSLGNFWASLMRSKPTLAGEAMKSLLPFATTYLAEQGFSALTVIKTKYRGRLQPGNDMRLALTTIKPRFERLAAMKQHQGAH